MRDVSSINNKQYQLYKAGVVLYGATIVGYMLLLLVEPVWFDFMTSILPVILLLLTGSVLLSYRFARTKSSRAITVLATLALTVLLTLLAIFAIALVAWLIGVYHATN